MTESRKLSVEVCAENMAWNVLTNGMSMLLEKFKGLRKLRSFGIFRIHTDHQIEHNTAGLTWSCWTNSNLPNN